MFPPPPLRYRSQQGWGRTRSRLAEPGRSLGDDGLLHGGAGVLRQLATFAGGGPRPRDACCRRKRCNDSPTGTLVLSGARSQAKHRSVQQNRAVARHDRAHGRGPLAWPSGARPAPNKLATSEIAVGAKAVTSNRHLMWISRDSLRGLEWPAHSEGAIALTLRSGASRARRPCGAAPLRRSDLILA